MTEQQFYQKLGGRLRNARKAKGWTQLRLGVEIGTSAVAVHNWETGLRRPDLFTLRRLEAALGQEIVQ